jgi:hypothetical protein
VMPVKAGRQHLDLDGNAVIHCNGVEDFGTSQVGALKDLACERAAVS